jgi:hypothetical protein
MSLAHRSVPGRDVGVLAVAAGTTFADGYGRSDYFTRELFYRP